MINTRGTFWCLLFCALVFTTNAQDQSVEAAVPNLLTEEWNAEWIALPNQNPQEYGVYLFRKQIELAKKPEQFPVHISADNRYKLYVNEQLVSLGPARGDLTHWNYETVDLAAYLKSGRNIIAAKVWNMGTFIPEAQITLRTAFILQGGTSQAQLLNTNSTWKVKKDESISLIPVQMSTYYVAGPGERVDMANRQKNWKKWAFDDSTWQKAVALSKGLPKGKIGHFGVVADWLLVLSILPSMELTYQRIETVRKVEGMALPPDFPKNKKSITIPANSTVTILLDQTFLTNAYPTIISSQGKGAEMVISYQEALFTAYPEKGNRNEIADKTFAGRADVLLFDGTDNKSFTSLSWRTFRYLQLKITTKDAPLILEDIYGTFTGYPFKRVAKLHSADTFMQKVLDIGWRTSRLCAEETYMDCPYYEKLQYIGDARIQALISLYNTGDDRLLQHALNLMNQSRQVEGVTLSRHPSATPQYIPTFSLWYIGMLYDYMMYGNDLEFVKNKLPGVRQILHYFQGFQQADGSLRNIPHWSFTDWVTFEGWTAGVAPKGIDGSSAPIDLQLLWAYQVAAALEKALGYGDVAADYLRRAAQLKATIQATYWDTPKQLYADNSDKKHFSQHTNILAILTEVVADNQMTNLAKKALQDTTLAPASIYFKYYLHQGLTKAGMGNDYLSWLEKWQENIAMGLTTWAETSELNTTRSDCHAWGASPNIEFFRIVLGVDSAAPGFSKVKIAPHLGTLKKIGGEMPHPNGLIKVNYEVTERILKIAINLPSNTSGTFVWKGNVYELEAGDNRLEVLL
ncbi:MAG: alpha-L-rhamnosidase C-terminal domain-containing protein [Bacteroidota bacterium]